MNPYYKKNVLLCLILLLSINQTYSQNWQLKWSDEFNGNTLDASIWNIEVNGLGGYNNELQHYTSRPENVKVTNGNLVITAVKESYTAPYAEWQQDSLVTRQYTSARINSKGKKDFKYGKIEARIKVPYGTGVWPAFWMLGSEHEWPESGEIDIMEVVGGNGCGECDDKRVHGYLHWEDETLRGQTGYENVWQRAKSVGDNAIVYPNEKLSDNFRKYSVVWEENKITWFVDDIELYSQNTSNTLMSEFRDHAYYLLLNFAVGGDWPNNPDSNTVFPQEMLVDYVRVYEEVEIEDLCPNDPNKTAPGDCGCGVPENTCQLAFYDTPQPIPGVIEAETFDKGPNNVAYYDTTVGNEANNTYREGDVDLGETGDAGGGYSVGYIATGEWLEYQIYVDSTATYNIDFRIASNAATNSGKFHLKVGGNNVTNTMSVPNTGNWDTYQTITKTSVPLTKGYHEIQLYAEASGFNLNWMNFYIEDTVVDNCPNDPNKTEPGDCGCGVPDTDSDGDGVADCNETCPNDPNKTEPGDCGCGVEEGTCNTGCTETVINSNGFESGWGIWNDGGSDARRSSRDAAYANQGSFSIRLRDNTSSSTMTTDVIDLSNYYEIKVDFSYLARSMDNSNEDFWLQISTNGGSSFTTLEGWARNTDFQNNQRKSGSVVYSGALTNNVKLRFRCDASGNSDWVYIDDVVISGCKINTSAKDSSNHKHSTDANTIDVEEKNIIDITLYPNPASSSLFYKGNVKLNTTISVFEMATGRLLKRVKSSIKKEIDINSLSKGMYIVQFVDENNKTVIKRFIKK